MGLVRTQEKLLSATLYVSTSPVRYYSAVPTLFQLWLRRHSWLIPTACLCRPRVCTAAVKGPRDEHREAKLHLKYFICFKIYIVYKLRK